MASATFKKGARIEQWEKNLTDPKRALKQVGALLVAAAHESFDTQAFDGKAWQPRSNPNVYGILADFEAGRTPPSRRFEPRPVLVDTGRLAASITFRVIGSKSVEAGSDLEYAAVHNVGGPIKSVKITKRIQTALGEWLKKQPLKMQKTLGWLLNEKLEGTQLEGEVPARQFLGITTQLMRDVRDVVGIEIMETPR